MPILSDIQRLRNTSQKGLVVLLDPDKIGDEARTLDILAMAAQCKVKFLFVGGSLLTTTNFESALRFVKENTHIPVVIFPGSVHQISSEADAFLMLSLISGRNPDLLIGKHVEAAPYLKASGLETIPTGYMLVDGGKMTTATYISGTPPLPAHKPDIAASTALAGELLGLRLIYLDAGSGAETAISQNMIAAVRQSVSLPIIVGGGVRTPSQVAEAFDAGADLVVVGTAFEENPDLLFDFAAVAAKANF